MTRLVALSTVDNPYNPFEQWDEWLAYDLCHGYNCCALLDRMTNDIDNMKDDEATNEIETAIDNIVKHDVLDIYKKVVCESD